jgi:hypothetical protein
VEALKPNANKKSVLKPPVSIGTSTQPRRSHEEQIPVQAGRRHQPQAADLRRKVDLATFRTEGHLKLPALDGLAHWSRKKHYKQFTLHDPSPEDIAAVSQAAGPLPLTELEVAVDIRPDLSVDEDDRWNVVQDVMIEMFGRRLDPRGGKLMLSTFRAVYRPAWGAIGPFNRRLPLGADQQIRGHRSEAVQVKAYLKHRDQGKLLPKSQRVARVEVRMVTKALAAHGLYDVYDLNGFAYRKMLTPYFRHMSGVRPLVNTMGTPMGAVLCLANDKRNQVHWAAVGAGAFLNGGRRDHLNVKFKPDIPINDRFGQALHRLETRARAQQFVCKTLYLGNETVAFPLEEGDSAD